MTQIINHQSNYQKLPEIVTTLIDNNPLYQENLDREKMIELIKNIFNPAEVHDVNSISQEQLTKRIKS
ncbi:MAG: hypothetical protein ACKPE1_29530, partial [Dolichospermum sp.]